MASSNRKVLITGAAGMLGHRVAAAPPAGFEVVTADLPEFDITSLEESMAFVEKTAPGLILHCAAMTDVDRCESEFEKAYRINGIGAGNLARAAFECGAEILHVSTDYVFDGKKREPYIEDDPVCPESAYGLSKLAGETLVRDNNPRHWIVRTQWLYGQGGKNFVDTIVRAASERDRLDVVDDQVGCPTFTGDLSGQIWRIAQSRPPYGIYHGANNGSCSWFEFASRIVALKGIEGAEVHPMSSDRLDRPAKRPAHSVLDNLRLRLTVGDLMRPWDEALQDYLGAS